MRGRILAAAFLISSLVCGLSAESAQPATRPAQWAGVWQGELDGLPSVTLTLANDTGQLGGTLVLNIIEKEDGGARIKAREPHVLVHPQLDGNTLSFGVRKIDGSSDLLNFTVALTPEGKARIHCTNCGADAPVVDMSRIG
jgi:hypothetical protein